ncbi:methylenetetrahydrofolate--tRNA-(uracil(54)-C(5))-methyltransferase (FADH(2)-oxidizing) TrmFO [bacterium]|nr:methylenetetrahydrofolate--tRNA-(uracil(54)-C(5))-methyltransferase (FADH(2)-oxidizing) TrmFO [bacterium]MBU1025312.1 methylenetetrahydrofolate--tRNA-(uracil(54)-C(5))-methyltransferase (FADH(2)-oxidizing) TrmFO [bacterium]
MIGGGLAGSSAALELASRNIQVELYEMRPEKMTPAHQTGDLAELVCSNSMGSRNTFSANGLLMAELEILDCELLKIAKTNGVPAGQALAPDRIRFAGEVTSTIENHLNINLIRDEVQLITRDSIVILASGPLTSDALIEEIKLLIGNEGLYFFDATSPTVTLDSVDMSRAFWANRRDPDAHDYLNCPLDVDEFNEFFEALRDAERVEIKDFEPDKLFESCLPVEIIATRDSDALRFGPMKPVGLKDPETQKGHYAIVQLRKEDKDGKNLNMVGFQTRLTYSEQKRVFSKIPALKDARFVRLGHMHKNFYIDAPSHLDEFLRLKSAPDIFMAGQITGGEGYLEAVAQGTIAAINVSRMLNNKNPVSFPPETMLGAFPKALTGFEGKNFQPMKVNFGMLPPLKNRVRGKRPRREKMAERSMETLSEFIKYENIMQ